MFLEKYTKDISLFKAKKIKKANNQTSIAWGKGKRLQTACWNQYPEPWNYYCPFVEGHRAPAGCVATAMAIIMKYHRWPLESKGGEVHYTTDKVSIDADLSGHKYKWDIMPDILMESLNPDDWSLLEPADQIAHLLYDAGVSVFMGYGPDESGATFEGARNALVNNFSFDESALFRTVTVWNDESIAEFKKEIDEDRPVFVGGYSSNPNISINKAHAFVMDGYDSNGLFHYNLGWGGENNGYYALYAITGDGYVFVDAIMNLKPNYSECENGKCGDDVNWTLRPDNVLVISGNGPMSDYVNGDTPWKDKASLIKDVNISGVTHIGSSAFAGFTALTSVEFPSTVISCGENILDGACNISMIRTDNKDVISVSSKTFTGFDTTKCSVIVPRGASEAYSQNEIWKSFKSIEEGLLVINGKCGDNVSWKLTDDGTLVISGSGPMYDYNYAVEGIESRPWAVPEWLNYNGNYNKFIRNIVIEEGVTTVGACAFYFLLNVESVELPNSLKSIGWWTFSCCTSLNRINLPPSLEAIDYGAFSDTAIREIEISSTSDKLIELSGTFENCSSLKKVTIGEGIKKLGTASFYSCI